MSEKYDAPGDLATSAAPGPVGDLAASTASASSAAVTFRRFLRNKTAVAGLVIFAVILLFALFGGFLTSWDYKTNDFAALGVSPGTGDHILGTNDGGIDLYASIVHGLQRSMVIAFLVTIGTTIISTLVGTIAAYLGGLTERISLLVINFMLVVPSLLILGLVGKRFGGDWKALIVVLIIFGWPFQARITWSLAQSVAASDFVRAAKYMGLGPLRIAVRHIVPNMSSLIIVNIVYGVVSTIIAETSLSFIGFGVRIPDVSLGSLLAQGTASVTSSPWLFYYPALVLTLLTMSLSLVGDGLRDAFDPTSSGRGVRRKKRVKTPARVSIAKGDKS
ncbi:ABC transporter permease [Williamsia sp. CHRR-6]|uniref:ABC transporter permease n=1 Tax=Williamsia sp. CHRR-6 TaxID=2835871 RepID=UPI001BDAD05B|nr:ABC transporter permease [Williamsia sp. CHRR-6]MBT0566831.1 ABC transporter permease [Williamsia sp. CHRR-6]